MKKRLKMTFLIVAVVGTAAFATNLGAAEATYTHTSQIDGLPAWEGRYGVHEERPLEEWNKSVSDCEIMTETTADTQGRYDPRKESDVTSVKDQGEWGLCWDYATIAAYESCMIRQSGYGRDVDLSELHLAYFTYQQEKGGESFVSFCAGGGGESGILFQRNIGPVPESVVPMREITNETVVDESLKYSHFGPALIKMVRCAGSDINGIKNMITTYGGVYASFCFYESEQYFNDTLGDTAYHFPYHVTTENHAVEIVGWDDGYSAGNFKTPVEADGAWLVKNSWGAHGYSGEGSGFYWVPYSEFSLSKSTVVSYVLGSEEQKVKSVSFAQKEITMYAGQSRGLSVSVLPENTPDKGVMIEHKPGSPICLEIKDGEIKALKEGVSTILVRSSAYTDLTDECTVTVLKETITADVPDRIQGLDASFKITAEAQVSKDFTYKSSNEKVLTVDADGTLKAAGYGTSDITISSEWADPVRKRVKVVPARFETDATHLKGHAGEERAFDVFLDGKLLGRENRELSMNAGGILYYSSTPSETGQITLSPGSNSIRLTSPGREEITLTYETQDVILTCTFHVECEEDEQEASDKQEEAAAYPPAAQGSGSSAGESADDDRKAAESELAGEEPPDENAMFQYKGDVYLIIGKGQAVLFEHRSKKAKVTIEKYVLDGDRRYKVCAISERAFAGDKKIKNLTVKADADIEKEAFEGCTQLMSVKIKGNTGVVGQSAFKGCRKLADIELSGGRIKKIGKGAFRSISKKAKFKLNTARRKKYKKLIAASKK